MNIKYLTILIVSFLIIGPLLFLRISNMVTPDFPWEDSFDIPYYKEEIIDPYGFSYNISIFIHCYNSYRHFKALIYGQEFECDFGVKNYSEEDNFMAELLVSIKDENGNVSDETNQSFVVTRLRNNLTLPIRIAKIGMNNAHVKLTLRESDNQYLGDVETYFQFYAYSLGEYNQKELNDFAILISLIVILLSFPTFLRNIRDLIFTH